jgi:hypothetical protein
MSDTNGEFTDFETVDADVVDAEVVEEPVVEAVEEPVVEVDESPLKAALDGDIPAGAAAAGAAVGAGAQGALDSIKNVVQGGMGTGAASNALDDAAAFIGPKADYYIPAFQKMDSSGSAISWNWSAFFFGVLWMLYRKMYLYALVIWGVTFLLGVLTGGAGFGLSILEAIGIGLFGNWLYKRKVEEELAAAAPLEPAARKAQLAERGGVTWIPVIILGVLTLLGILSACGIGACAALSGLGDSF